MWSNTAALLLPLAWLPTLLVAVPGLTPPLPLPSIRLLAAAPGLVAVVTMPFCCVSVAGVTGLDDVEAAWPAAG